MAFCDRDILKAQTNMDGPKRLLHREAQIQTCEGPVSASLMYPKM